MREKKKRETREDSVMNVVIYVLRPFHRGGGKRVEDVDISRARQNVSGTFHQPHLLLQVRRLPGGCSLSAGLNGRSGRAIPLSAAISQQFSQVQVRRDRCSPKCRLKRRRSHGW